MCVDEEKAEKERECVREKTRKRCTETKMKLVALLQAPLAATPDLQGCFVQLVDVTVSSFTCALIGWVLSAAFAGLWFVGRKDASRSRLVADCTLKYWNTKILMYYLSLIQTLFQKFIQPTCSARHQFPDLGSTALFDNDRKSVYVAHYTNILIRQD